MVSDVQLTDGQLKDAPKLAEIYYATYPEATSSMLGLKACENYFKSVLAHKSYNVIVAQHENAVKGYAILHLDMLNFMGKSWILKSWGSIFTFILRNPLYTLNRGIATLNHIRKNKRKKFVRTESTIPTQQDFATTAYLHDIAVSSTARGLGVGKRLLSECIDRAKLAGLSTLRLTVHLENEPAIKLYERLGFTKASETKSRNSAIYMIPLNGKSAG
jgi:ribosomal protein S18 acetylase RimI-like enzyme